MWFQILKYCFISQKCLLHNLDLVWCRCVVWLNKDVLEDEIERKEISHGFPSGLLIASKWKWWPPSKSPDFPVSSVCCLSMHDITVLSEILGSSGLNKLLSSCLQNSWNCVQLSSGKCQLRFSSSAIRTNSYKCVTDIPHEFHK